MAKVLLKGNEVCLIKSTKKCKFLLNYLLKNDTMLNGRRWF